MFSPWPTERASLDLCGPGLGGLLGADRLLGVLGPSPRVWLRGFVQGLQVANSGLKFQGGPRGFQGRPDANLV